MKIQVFRHDARLVLYLVAGFFLMRMKTNASKSDQVASVERIGSPATSYV